MHPRKKLDLGWRDLAFAIVVALGAGHRERRAAAVEASWSPRGGSIACLSVRSGLDLLLHCLGLPRGSEILVSAVTIRDMVRVIERHGLVPVPVDMDMDTLSVSAEALAKVTGPRTKAILVAHLFGGRMELDRIVRFARSRGLLLMEDCAQSFAGDGYRGHPGSDVVLHSFGPIKTHTALGGALVSVRSPRLLAELHRAHRKWPVAGRLWFLLRTLKYGALMLLTTRFGLRLLAAAARFAGTTHDEILGRAARGFPGPELFRRIRRRPSAGLLALMERRLRTVDARAIRARQARGREAVRLMPWIERPGSGAREHTHWVFPVSPRDPDGLMRRLWAAGFDATRGTSSLTVVPAPPNRPEADPVSARETMSRVLYLPVHPWLPERELRRLVLEIADHEDRTRSRDPMRRLVPVAGGAP